MADQDDISADQEYNGGDSADDDAPAVRVLFVFVAENDNHLEEMQENVVRRAEEVGFLAEHIFVADLQEGDIAQDSPLNRIVQRKRGKQ